MAVHTRKNSFSLEEKDKYWLARGVRHLGELVEVEMDKDRVLGGQYYTQDEFAQLSDRIPDARLETSVVVAFYKNKDSSFAKEIEQVRQNLLKPDFEDGIITQSRVVYKPEGLDAVIHNYKKPEMTEVKTQIVGPNGSLSQIADRKNFANAVLGNKNAKTVSDAYNWASERETFVWRINNKPDIVFERAVVLGRSIGNSRFDIDCNDDISNGRPARVMVIVGAKKFSHEPTRNEHVAVEEFNGYIKWNGKLYAPLPETFQPK